MNVDAKTCGNCKHFLPHRKNKYGFDGNCKEIIIKEGQTDIMDQINLSKEDKACVYFESKDQE